MNFDFKQTMKEAADAELVRIVITNRDEYQEAAITAAEAELLQRNLPEAKLLLLQDKQLQMNVQAALNASTPLEAYWKVLAFIFPGIIQLIIAGSFKAVGYDRKANELGRWTIFGIIFYIVLAVCSVIF
jgi:hypothetical protein